MSPCLTTDQRRNGGPRAAAVFVPRSFLYFRRSDDQLASRRTVPMLPDPATRPVVTAEEAFVELGIDRSTGYKSIRDGTFPLPIIRVGRLIRVPTAALRRLLQLEPADSTANQEVS